MIYFKKLPDDGMLHVYRRWLTKHAGTERDDWRFTFIYDINGGIVIDDPISEVAFRLKFQDEWV